MFFVSEIEEICVWEMRWRRQRN